MPRRKQLKGIALNLASSFISRNNDVDGYWALGLLYKEAVMSGTTMFTLNLETGESFPQYKFSKRLSIPYFDFLQDQLKKQGFEREQVVCADIELEFNTAPTSRQIMFKSTWGDPFVCKISLKDDLSRVWHVEVRGWCGQHDALSERRSIRRYTDIAK
ncbi:hypothetical protein A9Q79_02595 [Methylophaga sp. 42_25_T18]|nr:hypothetical protein A9Q79_02595 [Methylophaga sp. 42_25_T18]OUR87586.1 hypothetical protein A9Q92_04365 [Methylophaga sp. 42_8_T64]